MITPAALREILEPARSQPVRILSGYTLKAGGVYGFERAGLRGYSVLVVTVRASYDPNSTAGVRVRWLYSPDGVNYDSVEDSEAQGYYYNLSFKPGSVRQATVPIPLLSPHVRVEVVNLDPEYPVTLDLWV